jgi:SOS-response transcriptional repressor LexA
VVHLEDTQEAKFKQLIVEGGRMYLRALNADPIMEVTENAFICGVVVFKAERSYRVAWRDTGNDNSLHRSRN